MDFNKLMEQARAKREAATTQPSSISPEPNPIQEPTVEEPKPALSFMQQLAAKASAKAVTGPAPTLETPMGAPIVAPIPKVITAANLAAKATEGQEEAAIAGETEAALANIRQKIHDIQEMNQGELQGAMTTLREMLRANAAACSLMLPEDTGMIVRALRKMTGNAQALSMASAKTTKNSAKEKQLTAEEIIKLAAETNVDDWG